ncbi:unnamed protein product [Paramecium pentaurelia]|uniref:Uncharacterized protein n=1 Tax=Paramecium pentaurelia TaxID=43138 RepID=A0A8S1WW15_9CILI|nr:unnamed protein product [Paramecium pentaurelia]
MLQSYQTKFIIRIQFNLRLYERKQLIEYILSIYSMHYQTNFINEKTIIMVEQLIQRRRILEDIKLPQSVIILILKFLVNRNYFIKQFLFTFYSILIQLEIFI